MAKITNDRFNPIRAYCNVRLQQGVPLVDADVNELDDIRKFEVRAFLKWFVGNGIPEGNDGFRIAAIDSATDFEIQVGSQFVGPIPQGPSPATNEVALHQFGRCIVDGLDVIIQKNTRYSEQTLSEIDLEAPYSVPQLTPIPLAPIAGPVLVYLDIWERVVYPTEDPELIVQPLNTETCARIKRLWVVRTRLGTNVPVQGDPDFRANHLYYPLATIDRKLNGPQNPALIQTGDITDLRERGLSLLPPNLIQDTLGVATSQYRRGLNRPGISLREALNAITRGEVPAGPELPVGNISAFPGGVTLDRSNGLIVTLLPFINGYGQIVVARLDLGNPSAGFTTTQITSPSGGAHQLPSVIALSGGDLIVAYTDTKTRDIYFKRGPTPDALAAADAQQVTKTGRSYVQSSFPAGAGAHGPVIVASGNIVVFFFGTGGFQKDDPGQYHYRRYDVSTGTFLDQEPVEVRGANGGLHAAVDGAGDVWVAFYTTINELPHLQALRLNPLTRTEDRKFVWEVSSNDGLPFVLAAAGQVWVFFGQAAIQAFVPNTNLEPFQVTEYGGTFVAAHCSDNQIALAISRGYSPTPIKVSLGNANTRAFAAPNYASAPTSLTEQDSLVPNQGGIVEAAGSLWLVWVRWMSNDSRVYCRQIFYRL